MIKRLVVEARDGDTTGVGFGCAPVPLAKAQHCKVVKSVCAVLFSFFTERSSDGDNSSSTH